MATVTAYSLVPAYEPEPEAAILRILGDTTRLLIGISVIASSVEEAFDNERKSGTSEVNINSLLPYKITIERAEV